MDILGLDKIKHLDENSRVEVTGLEMIRRETVNITGLDCIRHADASDLPGMSAFAVKLIGLVSQAKELDTEYKEFGAEHHQYEFNPVIPLSQVSDFEHRHHIRLPQGYVDFLTQVGNGGAGPGYGIYSLEQTETECYYDHKNSFCPYTEVKNQPDFYTLPYTSEGKEPMVNSLLSPQYWDSWYNQLQRIASVGDGTAYDRMYSKAYNGLIQIIDEGCCTGYMLVCSGDLSGEIVFFRHELEMPQPVNMTFEDFIINHFKSIIHKYE